LYQITAASRTPDWGATTPRSPFSLSSTVFVEPPLNKIPGYATGPRRVAVQQDRVLYTDVGSEYMEVIMIYTEWGEMYC